MAQDSPNLLTRRERNFLITKLFQIEILYLGVKNIKPLSQD